MLEVIEKLLILQDRDSKIMQLQEELSRIGPDRKAIQARLAGASAGLEAAKHRAKQLESERKKLELEVDAKKQLIERYSLQQFQTKKNEEYRALAHEIELCKEGIVKLDDQQIEIMEKMEAEQRLVARAAIENAEAKKTADSRIADLDKTEANLKKELEGLQSNRSELASAVEESARARYERLLKQRGQTVIVGIQHGVCGGCHMQLSRSVLVNCQGGKEIVTCTNCGRILYYTRDMDLAVAD
jgi:predicted  nucleic acid-binding Zn-ribbon protein